MRTLLTLIAALGLLAIPAAAQEDEIVANLAGGRVIIHVAVDGIAFAAGINGLKYLAERAFCELGFDRGLARHEVEKDVLEGAAPSAPQ